MATLLERSLDLLTRAAGVTVRYSRAGRSADWLAAPGTSDVEQVYEGESTLVSRRQDFLGPKPVIDGATITPKRGDLIEWERNGGIDVFEVMPASGEDWFTPSDAYGKRIRVHTKFVETRPSE